jgi:cobalamin biosynthesis protein CobD/CbiB
MLNKKSSKVSSVDSANIEIRAYENVKNEIHYLDNKYANVFWGGFVLFLIFAVLTGILLTFIQPNSQNLFLVLVAYLLAMCLLLSALGIIISMGAGGAILSLEKLLDKQINQIANKENS